ncbi:MAG: thioredoxin-disulfide reductase [Candidatus Omnitrophica bacterium]|nr:thioredoxin-disulfide reductase [Candidatus Omnitrophota bacterium]
MSEYDLVIIGAGPAGLTAGLYAQRAGMKVIMLEKLQPGGLLFWTETIENFPGFPEGVSGRELAERFRAQAVQAGLTIVTQEVKQIVWVQPTEALKWYSVKTQEREYNIHCVILASGAHPKRINVPREEMLTGKGVSYCATCDGPLFRDQDIVVVGGGNAACEEALYLAKFARKVSLIHRRDRLRADQLLQQRLKANPKINILWNTVVLEILGAEKVTGVKIEDVATAKRSELSCAGVFIFAGFKPNTDFVKGLVNLDIQGFITTDANLQTSRPGIFACGDCRLRALAQIVTACGEGAQAAQAARQYVDQLTGRTYA